MALPNRFAALAAVSASLFAAAPASVAQQPRVPSVDFSGTWDLVWQTRRGPSRRGYIVFRQNGTRLQGEIHGQGSVRASGTVSGSTFALRGSRMAVPYRIDGRASGDRLEGTLSVLSVRRRFTGTRRR